MHSQKPGAERNVLVWDAKGDFAVVREVEAGDEALQRRVRLLQMARPSPPTVCLIVSPSPRRAARSAAALLKVSHTWRAGLMALWNSGITWNSVALWVRRQRANYYPDG